MIKYEELENYIQENFEKIYISDSSDSDICDDIEIFENNNISINERYYLFDSNCVNLGCSGWCSTPTNEISIICNFCNKLNDRSQEGNLYTSTIIGHTYEEQKEIRGQYYNNMLDDLNKIKQKKQHKTRITTIALSAMFLMSSVCINNFFS